LHRSRPQRHSRGKSENLLNFHWFLSDRLPRFGRSRSGAGFLVVLALGLAAVLLVIVVYQAGFGTQLTGQTGRAIAGMNARDLARSAAEDVRARLSTALDPETDLGVLFRQEIFDPDTGIRDLTLQVVPERALGLAGSGPFRNLSLDPVMVSISSQTPLESTGYERRGRVTIDVKVTGSRVSTPIRQHLSREIDFLVTLVTVPRPFDQFGFWLTSSTDRLDFVWLNERRLQLIEQAGSLQSRLEAVRNGSEGPVLTQVEAMLERLLTPAEIEQRLPSFSEDPDVALAALWFRPQSMDLRNLNLTRRVAEALEDHGRAYAQYQELDPGSGVLAPAKVHAWLTSIENILKATDEVMLLLWSFMNGVRVLGPENPERLDIEQYRSRLQSPYFEARAAYRFETADGSSPVPAVTAFLASAPRASGILFARSRGSSGPGLQLSGTRQGRAVIAMNGIDVALKDLNGAPTAEDSLLIAVFGGEVSIEGHVRAAVLVGDRVEEDGTRIPGRVRFPAGATLTGALIMDQLDRGSVLEGTVVRDERYIASQKGASTASGISHRQLWVAFDPEPGRDHWSAP